MGNTVLECVPDREGRRCVRCGWRWSLWPDPWPRNRCGAAGSPDEWAAKLEAQLGKLPGWQLHQSLRRLLGQEAVAGCGCLPLMAEMDAWGIDGCLARIDLINDHLVAVATERQWLLAAEPGVDQAAIGTPVPQTRRTRAARRVARSLSGTAAGAAIVRETCRHIVVSAIRRAERALADLDAASTAAATRPREPRPSGSRRDRRRSPPGRRGT